MAETLRQCQDPDLAADIETFVDWTEDFHRRGLARLVQMIEAWRGEIFLDAVARDPIAGAFLKAYGLRQ